MITKRSKGHKHLETGMNGACNYIGEFSPLGVPHSCCMEFSVGAFSVSVCVCVCGGGGGRHITRGED